MYKPATEAKFPKERIDQEVRRIAKEIYEDYVLNDLVLVGVMEGAIYFLTDLLRELHRLEPCSNVRVTTANVKSSFENELPLCKWLPPQDEIQGRDAVIVDDIVSNGKATNFLREKLCGMGAKSVRVCAMLYQYNRGIGESKTAVEYFGFKVSHFGWLGYGLDVEGYYRNLPGIHEIQH